MRHFNDPHQMPGTGESPEEILNRATPLFGTVGAAYIERRGISTETAHGAGVRFCEKFGDRPAVVIPLRDQHNKITSIHGRYLTTIRQQNKMLTIGHDNGIISVISGWRKDPLILVEGLFDALSLAQCGWSASAPIGQSISWLPKVCRERTVWLAFDACKAAEADVIRYRSILHNARTKRMLPPVRCQDWNTALVKRGAHTITNWINKTITTTKEL